MFSTRESVTLQMSRRAQRNVFLSKLALILVLALLGLLLLAAGGGLFSQRWWLKMTRH